MLGVIALLAGTALAAPRERVGIIDLTPSLPDAAAVRQDIASALLARGLTPVLDDGVAAALAGTLVDADAAALATALAEAQRAFGALDCAAAQAASRTALGHAAARQAAGLPAPELTRAWTYLLLCADRAGDTDAAMRAASRLRSLGGDAAVPRDVWTRYPEVDAMLDREMVPVEITAEIAGAAIWIDFARAGVSPLRTVLPAGEHVIAAAAAAGDRRGWAAGTAVRSQPAIAIPMPAQAAPHAALARTIASWAGAVPSPAQLAPVLAEIGARVVVLRRADTLEVWGHVGRSEEPYRLGGDDGQGPVTDAPRLAALIADRVAGWNDRAPDPDRPLLTEADAPAIGRSIGRSAGATERPTPWWVYAAIAGAVAVSGGIVLMHDAGTDTQRVELRVP